MPLPRWQDEWEPADPLEGRRGWAEHHYFAVGVFFGLVVAALGVTVPAVSDHRNRERVVNREFETFPTAIAGVDVMPGADGTDIRR